MTVLPDPPAPIPDIAPAVTLPRRRTFDARRAQPFAAGAGVMLAAALLYGVVAPRPVALTQADVDDAIAAALASQSAPPDAETAFAAIAPSLVVIDVEATAADGSREVREGAGFVLNEQGEIMTALHVVDGGAAINLTFADGTTSGATISSRSIETDVAVLTPTSLPATVMPATLGGGDLQVGSAVFVVGNPFGLLGSLSAGVVSGLDRSFTSEETGRTYAGLIQVDAAVNPGNSGGPLVDAEGRVLGVVTALVNPTEQDVFIGIGLAVPLGGAGGGGGPGAEPGGGIGIPQY